MSFALPSFLVTLQGQVLNRINACKLNINFKEGEGITLLDTFPMTYSDAQSYDPLTFTLTKKGDCAGVNYNISMISSCSDCDQTDGICNIDGNTCDCNNQIDSTLISYELTNLTTGEIYEGTDPYSLNLAETFSSEEETIDYEIKLWINEKATNEDIYISTDVTPYTTKDFCAKLNIDVYNAAPSYCFATTPDNENNTVTITDYLCYEGNEYGYETITDVAIPKTFRVEQEIYTYVVDTTAYEDEEKVAACTQSFVTNLGTTEEQSQTICTGGTVDEVSLQVIIDQVPVWIETLNLEEIGMVKKMKEPITYVVDNNAYENETKVAACTESFMTNIGWDEDVSRTICSGGNAYGYTLNTLTIAEPSLVQELNLIGIGMMKPIEGTISGYKLVENPSAEAISNCVTTFVGMGNPETEAQTVCSGGELDGTTLEDVMQDPEMNLMFGSMLDGTGMVEMIIEEAPPVYVDCTVATIGDSAFSNKGLTSITIPDSITTINNSAFLNNELKVIEIPDSVTSIGSSAFNSNNIKSLTLGSGVKTIGASAFSNNEFSVVEIPDSVTSIGTTAFDYLELNNNSIVSIEKVRKCFGYYRSDNNATITSYNCTDITNPVIPSTLDGYTVNAISERDSSSGVFYNKGLTSVVFPDTLKTIGAYAFYQNYNLTGVLVIPNSVTSIGKYAFYENNLTSLILGNSVTTIGNSAFYENNLTSLILGNSVQTIGEFAFYKNENLTGALVIPDSVTTIGNYAFYENNLTSLTLGNSVTTIGYNAFYENNLTSLILGNSVQTIGEFAFYKNENLTGALVIPDSVINIGQSAFYENNLTSLTLGNSVTTIGGSAFSDNTNLTGELVIPDSVTTIGHRAFEDNNITSLILGNSVETIGFRAFYGNNNLTGALVIPDSATSIGEAAFYYNNLTSLTLGNSVETIDASAFFFNENLTGTLVIPDSATSIGEAAFYENNLTSVVIGENSNLTESTGIGSKAFYSTSSSNKNLSTIYNNSNKSFDFTGAITGTAGTPFITGTVPSYDSNIVTITTGYPE